MPISLLRSGVWTLHFLGLALAAFWLAWWLLTPLDFGYRLGYQLLDINAHISEFGPENLYRHGYEKTTQAQRFEHFHAILNAVNHGGNGLADIRYQVEGQASTPLLRDAEVIHLQDVAALISLFHAAGIVSVGVWLATAGLAKRLHWGIPPGRQLLIGGCALLLACGGATLLMGPTNVFYWLHTHIFPEDHQWFFYYQESLMTTLMKAPDLFGFIAVLWVATSVALIVAGILVMRKTVR